MDFSAELTTAEKMTACTKAINILEPSVYEAILNMGLIPADIASDYTAPGTLETHPLEHRIETELAKLNAVKAHLASLSG
jgi:hypothetical protein